MPDLDDLFEDIVDGVKKRLHKQKKRRKEQKSAKKKPTTTTFMARVSSMLGELRAAPLVQTQPSQPQSSQSANVAPVRSSTLHRYLEQAQAYQAGIIELMHSAPNDFNRIRMEELTRHIYHWQNSLTALVQRVDDFQQNALLQHDLQTVPKAVTRLESQLANASSGRIQQELKRTLANRQQQLTTLENLRDTMQWAEIKIENTVSMLGTIYSQALMSQSKGQVANYRRLLADVEEEARSLDDYVAAVAEVKLGDSVGSPSARDAL